SRVVWHVPGHRERTSRSPIGGRNGLLRPHMRRQPVTINSDIQSSEQCVLIRPRVPGWRMLLTPLILYRGLFSRESVRLVALCPLVVVEGLPSLYEIHRVLAKQ